MNRCFPMIRDPLLILAIRRRARRPACRMSQPASSSNSCQLAETSWITAKPIGYQSKLLVEVLVSCCMLASCSVTLVGAPVT